MFGDERQYNSILMNFLSKALELTPQNGTQGKLSVKLKVLNHQLKFRESDLNKLSWVPEYIANSNSHEEEKAKMKKLLTLKSKMAKPKDKIEPG